MGIGNPLQLQGKLQNMLKKILHENSGLINFPELSEFDFIWIEESEFVDHVVSFSVP